MMLLGQKIKELRMECYKDNWPSNLVIDMKSCNFVNKINSARNHACFPAEGVR